MTADMIDIRSPAAPGSLMRSVLIEQPGRYRIARRDCELYSVQIPSCGDFAKMIISTGAGRGIFFMPSVFTGSFWLSAACEDGLIVELFALNTATVQINYRERDRVIG